MNLLTKTACVSVLAAIAATPAISAPISWSAPAEIVNESVIQDNVSSAFNFTNTNATLTVTANGDNVDFVSTASGPVTSNGLTVTFTGNFNTGIQPLGFWNGTVLADADFNTIMDSFAHGPSGASVTGTFELSGLTDGTQYSVQLFASDTRSGQASRTIQYGDGLGNTTAKVNQGTKPYFIGTFTADGTTQAFTALSDTSGGNASGSPIINAMTVTVVPEPTSLALLGLGGLLIARRRR